MISYFKYTSGEAFTYNDNQDYVGFFHIIDGVPYSDKLTTVDSIQLTPKSTFMGKFYMDLGNFNTVYTNIEQLRAYYSNTFDILNKQGLDTALDSLDDGNLTIFKDNILGNPIIYNIEENSSFFYGLTSTSDIPSGKTDNIAVLPFSSIPTWEFMDNVIDADFTVDTSETFKYFCTDGLNLYVVVGNFLDSVTPLNYTIEAVLSSTTTLDYLYNIHHDVDTQQLFFVQSDTINIYDTSNFDVCQNLIILDRIALQDINIFNNIWNELTNFKWEEAAFVYEAHFSIFDPYYRTFTNPNNPHFIKFGNNIRTSLSGTDLIIYNKHSSEIYNKISLLPYKMSQVLSIDARNTDDNVLVLYRYIDTIRILHIDTSLPNINAVLSDNKLESIQLIDDFNYRYVPTFDPLTNYTVKFSDIDSDMFYISTPTEYQTRFLSYPKYPAGRLEDGNLFFPVNYIWGQTNISYDSFIGPWNYASLDSNNYNAIISNEVVKNDKMYMLHQNVGRLYAIHQPPNDRFINTIPLDIITNFNGTRCSESSFGLYFNNAISNIVKDTVNLFIKSYGRFIINERSVTVRDLEDLVQLTNNLYLNGNETFNVLVLQSIFLLINKIQATLIPETG